MLEDRALSGWVWVGWKLKPCFPEGEVGASRMGSGEGGVCEGKHWRLGKGIAERLGPC